GAARDGGVDAVAKPPDGDADQDGSRAARDAPAGRRGGRRLRDDAVRSRRSRPVPARGRGRLDHPRGRAGEPRPGGRLDADPADAGWAREQQRLQALVAARRARQAEVESGLTAERRRATELGAQAKNLKDLLDRTEAEVAAAKRSAEEAKAAAEREVRITQERFAAAGFRDPARLAPKVHFAEARGEVPRPVSGRVARGFNQPDGNGGTTRGVSFTTRPKASVSSPADGWVQFAGPFRSYGQLLIINAGDGYYLLLAGMDQISVEVGQFVLAGEPVGSMGDRGGGPGGSEGDPTLYVEFKKDGGSIDPEPWWAKSPNNTVLGEKVRG
uniref:murein hydrolase activator EnvC family protein n=1 Tax=Methylobacterium sp. B34 TaxID=95563 RepID=UPI001FCBE034